MEAETEEILGFAAYSQTVDIDDEIAMGHCVTFSSLPSRDTIDASDACMVNAHEADDKICISNCDQFTPAMLMEAKYPKLHA